MTFKTPPSFSLNLLQACILTLALVTLGLSACKKAPPVSRAAPPVPVQVAVADTRSLPILQNAIGTVQALRTVAVKSQVDGVIADVHFKEGDEVKAGDLLITLDRRPYENSLRISRADLANAKAEALRARADAERYKQLDQQSVVSKEQYATLQTKAETTAAQVAAKEAAVANAELQLGYTDIRAPISGRTGQLGLHEGALVRANDASTSIVVINQQQPINVSYAVPESSLTALRKALAAGPVPVMTKPREGGGQPVEGKLDFVDNSVDATTGMITLKAIFANADHALWPGQFVDVSTRVGVDVDVVLIPAAAIQVGQRGSQVFVVKPDNTVDLRPVKTGRTADGLTIVIEGVKSGETVVTDGQLRLVPGAKVEARVLGEPAAPRGKGPGGGKGKDKATEGKTVSGGVNAAVSTTPSGT